MKNTLAFLLIALFLNVHAQNSKDFTRDKEFYLAGNTAVIGNSILGKHASKPFDKRDKVNDEYKMKYIDIDSDASTWSSSSAHLSVSTDAEIVYAGLYWSGTYPGERSAQRKNNVRIYYKKTEERAHDFQEILFKGPNQTYQKVRGALIYDGKNSQNKSIKGRAPYACMADVTEFVKGQNEGSYTVANVSATQGKIAGGSAAGWLLYVVYKDASQPLQYITTYHGLESINKQGVDVDFGNFRSSEKGEVETFVTIGAIEGDSNLGKDQAQIYNPKSKTFKSLKNEVRSSSNFFNSSITLEDVAYRARVPNSANTLGFDIAKLKIPNEQNAIIANSATGVKMRFNTRSDRFFLFFTAFQTRLSERFYEEVVVQKNLQQAPVTQSETAIEIAATQNEIPSQPQTIPVVLETIPTPVSSVPVATTEGIDEILAGVIDSRSVTIPNIARGFYIISNVFTSAENAQKWTQTLLSKGLRSNTFFRPEKNFYYVAVGNNTDPVILYGVLKNTKTDEDLKDAWMLKINMD